MELTSSYIEELMKKSIFFNNQWHNSSEIEDYKSDIEDIFIDKQYLNIKVLKLIEIIEFVLHFNESENCDISVIESESDIGILGAFTIKKNEEIIFRNLFLSLNTTFEKKMEYLSSLLKGDFSLELYYLQFRNLLTGEDYSEVAFTTLDKNDYSIIQFYLAIDKTENNTNNKTIKSKKYYYRLTTNERELLEIVKKNDNHKFCQRYSEILNQTLQSTNFRSKMLKNRIFIDLCLKNELLTPLKDIKSIHIYDENINELPRAVWKLSNIETLSYHCGYEKGSSSLKELSRELGLLTNLKELIICGTQIEIIPDAIGELYNLKELTLHSNKIKYLPNSIQKLINLEKIWLDYNKLDEFPDFMKNLKSLKTIELRGNKLTEFSKSICELYNLEVLNLKDNDIKSIPREIRNLKKLKYLRLEGNPINELPPEIEEMNIERLNIKYTNIDIKSLPDSVKKILYNY